MRTRIKVIEKNNGVCQYQPQVKDELTLLDVILFLPVLFITGKFIWRYAGLNTYENDDLFGLRPLNMHPGFSSEKGKIDYIGQCHTTEGLKFTTLSEANIYLEKYLQQVKEENDKIKNKVNEALANEVKREFYIENRKIKENEI